MTIYTLLNFMFLLPLFASLFFYRSKCRGMVRFYMAMGRSSNARKGYAFVLIFILSLFNCTYMWLHPLEMQSLGSIALLVYLFSLKRTIGLLEAIRNNRYVEGMLFTLALASLFSDSLYNLGIDLGYILVASLYYPSSKARSDEHLSKVYKSYDELVHDTVLTYFL